MRLGIQARFNRGFTLMEILVAMALFAGVIGMIYSLVIKGIEYRKLASDLSKAVFLANEKMNSIKSIMKTASEKGKYENEPGFAYEYKIEEEDLELQKLLDQLGQGEDFAATEAGKFMAERGMLGKSATGLSFKLLRYEVIITYSFNRTYTLEFYRGLGIF
ncbi:MAG: prepilin-type N-terminal cleavage/methylation domain-containing protein [Leptospiraceae bacterium]|nr:prepilin-type N-terminal cleavage/methylation domain-containing protein [Leptospiraceae bacterium]